MPLLQVCVWVCAWVSVSAVIDTSDSIEYDSQRLSFNTHATARHVPLTHAQSSSLSQCDGNANNYNNNERRSVRTLTAAAATYTPEFSCDETKTGVGCVGGVCRHRRRRWHLLVVLWFYFECSPITTSLSKSRAGEQRGQGGNGGTELVTLHHLTKLSIRLWALIEHSHLLKYYCEYYSTYS